MVVIVLSSQVARTSLKFKVWLALCLCISQCIVAFGPCLFCVVLPCFVVLRKARCLFLLLWSWSFSPAQLRSVYLWLRSMVLVRTAGFPSQTDFCRFRPL